MSAEPEIDTTVAVEIGAWVEKAKADPKAYQERQATEVFLTSLGMVKPYSHQVFLKGGILMGVVYASPRQTGDIDLTTIIDPQPGIAEEMGKALESAFPRAAADLGYPDLMCAVQSVKYFPKGEAFPKNDGPSIKMKVGYALRGSKQQRTFEQGMATDVLEIDISFREPVGAIQIIRFKDTGGSVRAYSLFDLIAEKLRALLQQEVRNRFRRQDIYDLDALIGRFEMDSAEKSSLLKILLAKCASRKINPDIDALSQPEIVRRAKEEWHTLELEIGAIPDFDECFTRVNAFYRSLPWV